LQQQIVAINIIRGFQCIHNTFLHQKGYFYVNLIQGSDKKCPDPTEPGYGSATPHSTDILDQKACNLLPIEYVKAYRFQGLTVSSHKPRKHLVKVNSG
jgi:hypothetical protein